MSGIIRSTPGVDVSRPNNTPQSTTIQAPFVRRPITVAIEIHADFARPSEREEYEFRSSVARLALHSLW